MEDKIQLNNFNNTNEKENIYSSNIKAFKKVSFNTASANDYVTNEAYKILRTNLLFCGSDIKTVVLTSCTENEGKSTIATELTKSLADGGKRALLIDADMRKSVMLRRNMRAGDIEGLSDVLSGLAEPESVVYATQIDNFDVMFSGRFPPNPVELIENGGFKEMLDAFKERYDYIIIDSPPLGMVIDAAVIASFCDGAALVVSEGRISRNVAITVKEQLEKSGCRILGAIINEVDKKHSSYHKKYYGKAYKY